MGIQTTSRSADKANLERQTTLGGRVELTGNGLFSGKPVRINLCPAEPDTGIVFRRTDIKGAPDILAVAENAALGEARYTNLKRENASVAMVEHLLAAANGLRVDNLLIEVDADEMPSLDGSAAPYVEAVDRAGLRELNAQRRVLSLKEKITVQSQDAVIEAEPCEKGLEINFTLDYGNKFLGRQSLMILVTPESFARDIASARTYVLRPEIEYFRARGIGGGATVENTVVVEEDGGSPTKLRFVDECVRHKVLDLIGDLALIGWPLCARISAEKSGHTLNARLAARIREAGLSNEYLTEATSKRQNATSEEFNGDR